MAVPIERRPFTAATCSPQLIPTNPAHVSNLDIKASDTAGSPSSAASPSPTPALGTSREWVVPPRPKPGRKPATDTPPTKRKAQNRAAQRAFRERRAARVGELEDELKQKAAQDENEKQHLQQQVKEAERDVKGWMERYKSLEAEIQLQRKENSDLIGQLERLRSETVSSSRGRSSEHLGSASGDFGEEQSVNHLQHTEFTGCGKCSIDTRCECVDEVLNQGSKNAIYDTVQQQSKRPLSPSQLEDKEKRVKTECTDPEQLETDFTTRFASRPALRVETQQTTEMSSPTTSGPIDPCGFCSNGTACICAELAAADQRHADSQYSPAGEIHRSFPITGTAASPSITSHQQQLRATTLRTGSLGRLLHFTPPPSDGDVKSATAEASQSSANPCAKGPGTCAQCRSDPKSMLFCKSLAASRSQSQPAASPPSSRAEGGCCGGRGPGGGCCGGPQLSRPPMRARTSSSLPHAPANPSPLRISCADAYQVLSGHDGFERANEDSGSWMPKLQASSAGAAGGEQGKVERHPLEIETANILSVLRDFDRRFK